MDPFNILNDMIHALSATKDIGTYEQRKVARTDVEGLGVSTAYTTDCGFETAILAEDTTHIVERYESREDAEVGHAKWVEFAKDRANTKVTDLGYGTTIGAEVRELVRSDDSYPTT